MKIHLPFLLLFAVVTTCCSAAEQHQQQQQQSASGNTGGSIDLSVNLSADEPESRSTQSKHGEQSSSSSSSSLSQSASTPFATYSSAERDHSQQQQQVVPEFGMRNPPKTSSSSSSSTQQSDHQKAFANYAAEQAQLTFEPSISSAYKHSSTGSSSGVVTREFSPSVYRMSDSAATNHGELLNAHESDQTYGQATRISHEMDSPYYSKTTAVDGSGGAASGGENSNSGDNGGFTPISMSVDEAFRKYFPAQKQDQEGGEQQQQQQQQQQNSGDVYGSSNQQQQQQQQTPKSSTQYITTYASDDGENAQQQHQQQQPPQPAKELFSIDSLREIVDKQPLARPDPFDPPSPPLSAFLPPPPEGSIRETQPAAQSNAVPQFGSLSNGGQQELIHHQQQQQQQLYSSQPQQQQQIIHQQYAAPPQQTPSSYVYKETIVESPMGGGGSSSAATSGAGGSVVHTSATSLNEESELPAEEGEDEGLPYNTENLDEEGKKLSYVYSRPVRLPDVSAGKIEGGGVSQYEVTPAGGVGADKQYNSEMEHIYRKPVSYENEEDSVDHGDEGSPYGSRQPQQQQITPQGYEEADKSMPYQQGVLTMPLNQQMVSMYSDDGNYNGKPGVQQQQQWTSGNDNRQAEFVDQSGQKDSQGPQAPIEYGGFVPIKKPGSGPQQQHQLTSFQTVGGGDVYSMEKQLSPPKGSNFFNVDPRPNYQLSAGVIPADHSGYVGPNNMSPMAGHVGGYQPQQPQQQPQQQQSSKYGNQVGNFLSKFPNLRFKPLYGKDAMKKLRELGISEDEFYGTVNKILKNSGVGPRPGGGPIYSGQLPFQMPKANLYRAPPKGGAPPHQHHHHHRHPSSISGNGGAPQMGPGGPSKMRPLGNGIPDEFDFNYFKDALPPGASYNPRDVGLDESVLAQIQLQDSGIGGYRFPTMIPTGTNILTTPGGGASKHHHRRPGPLSAFAKGPGKGAAAAAAAAGGASVPHAMNSIAMPFVLAGPRGPFGGGHHRGRVPYSATGKGFRSQYGYRAAASELKPQFVLPTKGSNAFKFLGQPVGSTGSSSAGSGATSLTSALLSSALLDDGSGLGGSGSGSLGNIFGIRSIKGIKSLVSYLTGGVSG